MNSTRSKPSPIREGLLAHVGNTPLVPITRINPNPKVQIWAKLESQNPGGSVKDRTALWMIERAEASGDLTPGKTIIEATSGNTGIGLAMVAAVKGYRILLAMSEGVSVERRKILAAYGAEFLLTPAEKSTDGAIELVYGMITAEPDRYYLADQYNNPANPLCHYESTAPEIWHQTEGNITHFVAAMGTTGTLMGASKKFRELNPAIRIIGAEPYLGHRIQGLKNLKESYVPGIYNPSSIDEKINVEDEAAYEMSRRLAREEGLLVGMSSGASMHVAVELAKQLDSGVIVALLSDGGERYLSTSLFQVASTDVAPTCLSFLNTLGGSYEPFVPLVNNDSVTMYSCGPTVHRRPHLGLLRRMMAADCVSRTLSFAGYKVRHVVSITDVDDNTVAESEATGEPMDELCRRHEQEFFEDLTALNILQADEYVRASEQVDAMVALTQELIERGVAYEKFNSVYFNIGRSANYGELSGKDLGKIRMGATVDLDRYDKNDPRDFTLFRRSNLAEVRKGISYKTPWGNERPSWHVQCSAMARAALGDRFDIHMASVELIFPHNENEIAQLRAITGKPQAKYWLHSELVLQNGKKISCEDNCVTLPDLLEKGYSAREIRYFLLRHHYRQPLHLSNEALDDARASLRRIDEFITNLREVPETAPQLDELDGWIVTMKEAFRVALFDDVNVPSAMAAVFRLIRQVNYAMSYGKLSQKGACAVFEALVYVDQVLGIIEPEPADEPIPAEVMHLLELREQARDAKDYEQADGIRNKLQTLGYLVEDRPNGQRIRKKSPFTSTCR